MSAMSIGSVIGVAWRYSTLGSNANTAAPAAAAQSDPVMVETSHATAAVANTNERIEKATTEAPGR